MKRFFFIFFFCILILPVNLFSQQQLADSLKARLKNAPPLEKVNLLNELSDVYQFINTGLAIDYAEQALDLGRELKYYKGMASSYGSLGYCYINMDNKKALKYTQTALDLRIKISDKPGISTSYNVMGVIYYYMGDYLKSIDFHIKALKLREEIGDVSKIATSYNNLALIHMALKNYDTALEFLNKALKIRENTKNQRGIGIILDNIGDIYRKKHDYAKALYCFRRSYKINKQLGNKKSEAYSIYNLGCINFDLGNYDSALVYLLRSKELYESLNEKNGLANSYNYMAKVYKAKNDISNTKKYAEMALEKASSINSADNISVAAELLQYAYGKTGQYKQAYHYMTLFKNTSDSLKSDDKIKRMAKMELDYKLEKMKQTQEIELSKQKNFIRTLIVVLLLLIIIAVLIAEGYTIKRKSNKKLNELNSQLSILNSTKDKFLSILAHDLKNPFQAIINSSKLLIDEDDEFSKEERLNFLKIINKSSESAYNLLENLLQWARTQMGNIKLDKAKLDMLKIAEDNITLTHNLAASKNITVNNMIDKEAFVCADEFSINTIMRNLLTNAIKFTPESGEITVSSIALNGFVQIDVSDNGIGLSQSDIDKLFRIDVNINEVGASKEKGTGLGLILCDEFVRANKGKMWVQSSPGKGSTFSFTLPKPEKCEERE